MHTCNVIFLIKVFEIWSHFLYAAVVQKHARTIRDDESSIVALKEDEQEKLEVYGKRCSQVCYRVAMCVVISV